MNAKITVISGGVGAARMLSGLMAVVEQAELTAIVNVGDDLELHGLRICPDLDTITYTLAGEINPETGWGLRGESWQAMESVKRYGGISWFGLGDRDLGTHLYRTQRSSEGATLSEITAEITAAWGLGLRLLPVTEDRLRTMVTLADGSEEAGEEISFQEYFVKHRHSVAVSSVRFEGAPSAIAGPGVLEAIETAERVVIAPSNPIVSIDPVLAVGGVREAIEARREDVVAVSPIVAGSALKGPADRLLKELGHEPSVVGVAKIYAPLASVLVIDEADQDRVDEIEAEGIRAVVTETIMSTPEIAAALARTVLDA
ncbi:MAG: 2-phospho-L-lactate transferase [Acidimicrobiales bacterium]|nr:2-phospho-L-lactate transferase [Acidimicrobiales bacterium]